MARPSQKALGKRKAGAPQAGNAAKKPKQGKGGKQGKNGGGSSGKDKPETEVGPTGKPKRRPDQPKKIKLRDQKVIPVPKTEFGGNDWDDDDEDEDEIMDMDLGEEKGLEVGNGKADGFLASLDQRALSRTVKETKRLHTLEKAREAPPKRAKAKAPSLSGSDLSDYDFDSEVDLDSEADLDEDEGDGSEGEGEESDDEGAFNDGYDDVSASDEDSSDNESSSASSDDDHQQRKKRPAKETEAEYEVSGRTRWVAPEPTEDDDTVEVGRLPIKLPSGEVRMVEGTTRVPLPPSKRPVRAVSESEDEEVPSESDEGDAGADAERMASKPGRFGRMGVAEIVSAKGWKNANKLEAAKEQIANVGAEILGGGELIDVGPLLTRLSTFALPTVPSPEDGEGVLAVPASIRGLAYLSQLAVYKDLIPGYRIRQLTALEESEKVRDEVRRLREGEKMLVRNYKGYLKSLEGEIKRRTPLGPVALKCFCDLLSAVPHFNFSENIMGVLVARLGRRSWDDDSELVLQTFISVFRADVAATYSQALVRLIARMIKERKFQVHANVLSCLLHLRLRTELNAMRDGKRARGRNANAKDDGPQKQYKSETRKKWQTKNQRKKEKELKEIEKEMAEAEAEVNQEERAQTQTETLKNLFVLYFSIIKHPGRSPLLSGALEGISHFAHLINVDFFRDLLQVLRKIIADKDEDDDQPDEVDISAGRVRVRMLGIVTAFDLLSGQGEALNIDLGDFVNELFALLRPLALDTGIEDPPEMTAAARADAAARAERAERQAQAQANRKPLRQPAHALTTSALLFRCLEAIFFPRYISGASAPPMRAAAFAKRLCECALMFPPATATLALEFVRRLALKENRLVNLLDTEERMFDGVYRPDMDDPQLTNPYATSLFELDILGERHWDGKVKREARRLREARLV